jgi:hypothetical protein
MISSSIVFASALLPDWRQRKGDRFQNGFSAYSPRVEAGC